MTVRKITDTFLKESLAGTGRRETYRDTTVQGLQLIVSPDGKSRVWYFEYRNRASQKKRKRIGFASQFNATSAKVEARKLQALVADGHDPQAEKMARKSRSLRAWIEGGYQTRLQQLRTGNDEKRRLLSAWSGILDQDMATLTAAQIGNIHNKHLQRGLKPATAERYWRTLSAALSAARRADIIDRNPIENATRTKTRADRRVRYLGQHDHLRPDIPGERQRLMQALSDAPEHLRVMIILAMNTGLRRGEIFKLRWSDVDLQKQTVSVRAENSKNHKSRVVGLNTAATAALQEYRVSRGNVVSLAGLVFENNGKPVTTNQRSWATLIRRAGIEDFTFHDLRHDCASQLVMAGVNLQVVRDILGHSSITLTERYAHLAPDAGHKLMDLICK